MAQATELRFFQTWDPVPVKAEKPADDALEQRIAKLAEFAAKNGPPFVDMLRQKQQDNPEYAFLQGGIGADYFRWKLYCVIYGLDPDQGLALEQWQLAPHQVQTSAANTTNPAPQEIPDPQHAYSSLAQLEKIAKELPYEVDDAFSRVLSTLNSTRASIKESKDWFMARSEHARGLAAKMAVRQVSLAAYEQQICIIYLANDVLLKSLNQQDNISRQNLDTTASAFRDALPIMLHTAFVAGNSSTEVHQRLTTILDHWASRSIYDPDTVEFLKYAMTHGPENANTAMKEARIAAQQQGPPLQAGMSDPNWSQAGGSVSHQPGAVMTHDPMWGGPGLNHMQHQSHMFPPHQGMPPAMAPDGWASQHGMPTAGRGMPPAGPPMAPGMPGYGQDPGFGGFAHPSQYPGMAPMGYMNQTPFVPPNQMGFDGVPSAAMSHPGGPLPMPGGHPGMPGGPQGWPQTGPAMPPEPQFAPPPEEPPTDPMSFPPGLLPALVKEHLRTEDNYVPLDKREVMEAGIPEPAPLDAYLTAQLDKFSAELRGYRPGTSRADLEEEDKRQKTRHSLGEKGPGRYGRQPTTEAPKYEDGSFKGEKRGDKGPAGLGFGDEDDKPDDPFSQYRKKRSGFYHESLSRSQAAAAARLQAAT